jgi:hypothetical protein
MANDDKGLPELGRELVDMTVAYAKQETVEPLKLLGGYVAKGVAGAAIASVGLVFLLVGVLRVLQVEGGTYLDGRLSMLPYLITLVVAGIVAVFTLSKIKGGDS